MDELVYFSLSTMLFNGVLGKISKGLGNNKILPYTSYITFKLQGNVLSLSTSDSSNFYTHYINLDEEYEEQEFSLKGEALIQLISRSTSEIVEFEIGEKFVTISTNGDYRFEKINELVPVQDHILNTTPYVISSIALGKLGIAEAGLGRLIVDQSLMGYMLNGKSVFTTNGVKLSEVKNFSETDFDPMLLTLDFVKLLLSLNGDISIYSMNGKIVAQSTEAIIYGPEQGGKEHYPDVSAFLQSMIEGFEGALNIELKPKVISDALSRLSIFNAGYVFFKVKDNVVSLTTDQKKSSVEVLIDFPKEINMPDCEVPVSQQQFSDLVSKHNKPLLIKYMAADSPLLLIGENLVQMIAPMVIK